MHAPGWTSVGVDSNPAQKRPLKISKDEKQSPRGQKTLVSVLEDFFLTNFKHCNSFVEVLPF